MMSEADAVKLAEKTCKDDAAAWVLLAKAMEQDLCKTNMGCGGCYQTRMFDQQGQIVMVAVAGNKKFAEGTRHPACAECLGTHGMESKRKAASEETKPKPKRTDAEIFADFKRLQFYV